MNRLSLFWPKPRIRRVRFELLSAARPFKAFFDFKNWSIRARLTAAVWLGVIIICAAMSVLLYTVQTREYMDGIDKKLLTGAQLPRTVIGADYHDRIVDKSSVSMADYLKIVDTYNKLCLKAGFQYLWSNLFLSDGSIVFTSGTSTSKDVAKGDHALFLDVHSDPPAFRPVQAAGVATFSSFHNEWGDGRMVLVPYKDARGRTYVVGASISIAELEARLRDTAIDTVALFIVILMIGTVISVLFADRLSRPLRTMSRLAEGIAAGRYGIEVAEASGGRELISLAESINAMSRGIEANSRDLRKLRSAVEQYPLLVAVTDLAGTIEFVNDRFVEMTGFSRTAALGRNIRMLQPDDARKADFERMWSLVSSGKCWSGELTDRCADGSMLPVEVTAGRFLDDRGEPANILFVHEDITEKKRAENIRKQDQERIRQLEADMARRERLTSTGFLLSALAHELRQPIQSLCLYGTHLLKLSKEWQAAPAGIPDTLAEVNRLIGVTQEIVNRLRKSVKPGHNVSRPTVIGDAVDHILALIGAELEAKGVEVICTAESAGKVVFVEPVEFELIVQNLVRNAFDALAESNAATPRIEIRAESQADGKAKISVIDNGPGIDERHHETLFKALFSTKEAGMGLGLAVCRHLARDLGGDLYLESSGPRGTAICLTLPEYVRPGKYA